jgi:hypothetical protein
MLMRKLCWTLFSSLLAALAAAQITPRIERDRLDAIDRLSGLQPGVRFLYAGNRIERIYGPIFGGGATPSDAFQGFLNGYSTVFAGGDARFQYSSEIPLSHGKFTVGVFDQFYGAYPVDQGYVTLLVRNELGYPLVLAVSNAKPVAGPIAPARVGAKAAVSIVRKHNSTLNSFEEPKLVIWSGEDKSHLAWTFIAEGPPAGGCTSCGAVPQRVEAFVDAHDGRILELRQAIWTIDVNGNVSGWATPGLKPDQANNPETLQPLNATGVNVTGGNSAFTNASGNFTISNSGSTPVTVNATLAGRWVRVVNQAGTTLSMSQAVTPPGPADFIFNDLRDEFSTSQINGLIQTDRIHDFIKAYSPAYPGVDIQLPCNVNIQGSCNAFFNGSSINFYRAATSGTPCPNMAFSTVVWHEYGHFVINRAGTPQGAYGEGMSDTLANMLGDTPWTGEDFRGQNTGPLRSAYNSITYPSGAAIHTAGQIVSGAFWLTLDQLNGTVGHATGLNIMRSHAVNSIVLRPPFVSPGLTVDVLTLDDTDGDITNGTPHYNEIAAGFGAKNLTAPPIQWIKFIPLILPPSFIEYASINRSTKLYFEVRSHAGTLDPTTLKAFTRWNDGAWIETPMFLKGPNSYLAQLKRPPSGTVVDWYVEGKDTLGRVTRFPIDAPNAYGSYVVAASLPTLVEDTMESELGWTVANAPSLTGGAWTRANPNGANLNGVLTNPEDDSNDAGTFCRFTGQGAVGAAAGTADVDGGPTQLISPVLNLAGSDALIEYKRWFFNDDGDDVLIVEVSNDNGATWHTMETVNGLQNTWVQRSFRLGKFVAGTSQVRVRFTVADEPNNSITEAGVDHFVVKRIVP